MATTKKNSAVKTKSPRPAATRRKPTAHPKTSTATGFRSFVRSADDTPFMTFRLTHQSVYWLILSLLVLALGIWVMYLNMKIENIYNQIDLSNASMNIQQRPVTKAPHSS